MAVRVRARDSRAVTCGTGPERNVESAARTHDNFRCAIVCLCEGLPNYRDAIDPAEHRLWRASRLGQRDAYRGAHCVNRLIAGREFIRADRERKGFACSGYDYNSDVELPPRRADSTWGGISP